jgi:serine phosphatase RsbU (regulator of sigma subunit)
MTGDALSPSLGPGVVFDRMTPAALRRAWDSSPALVAVTIGPDHVLVYQNDASQAMFGVRQLGVPLRDAFPEVTDAGVQPLTQVLESGDLVEVPRRRVGVRDLTGEDVVLRYVLAPLGPEGEPAEGVVITAIDATAEARAEQAAARTGLLAELSARMTAAADATAGLQALCEALVPDVADLAAVYVLPERPGPGARANPGRLEAMALADHLAGVGRPPPPVPRDRPPPWSGSLYAGEPVILPVTADSMPVLAPEPASAAWLATSRANTIAVLPLVVAGSLTGGLVLLATGERAGYREDDLSFLTNVAARAGAAIAHLRTQQRQRTVALRLQRALLPAAPPLLPGLSVTARYLAGAPEVEVGGDWWDVQDLGGGRVAIGIGDVSGRGVSAAAVMGQARAAMHAAGFANLPPARVLALLDAQLHDVTVPGRLDEPAFPQFATACYGVVEPADTLLIANAGHLPLLIRAPDGPVRMVELPPAAPLGLRIGGFAEEVVRFGAGETLAMFTDGLVETRTEDLHAGIAALAGALEEHGGESSIDALAERLLDVMSRRPGYGDDDLALILVRREPAA